MSTYFYIKNSRYFFICLTHVNTRYTFALSSGKCRKPRDMRSDTYFKELFQLAVYLGAAVEVDRCSNLPQTLR